MRIYGGWFKLVISALTIGCPKFSCYSRIVERGGVAFAVTTCTSSRMLRLFLLWNLAALAIAGEILEGGDQHSKPNVEILMHLPSEFDSLDSFLSFFRGESEDAEPKWRRKREVEGEKSGDKETEATKMEPAPVQAALRDDVPDQIAVPMMDIPRGIMQALYAPFEGDRFKDGPAVNDEEDRVQRDKRTFMDNSGERETTTAIPYWKRKKESPPFVTGRDGAGQKVTNYQPAQHRSLENGRESHSMKNLDKTVISNEITRNNQDSFYASTNRRTYNSRQAENYTPRTPKSVYDTIDYTNKRRNPDGRSGFGRNYDSRRAEKVTTEPFARQFTYPRPYDRPYYPLQGDVVGRGTEYYHRTVDPASGRIIYYANMPDPSRYYDPNLTYDPTGRSIYINGRTYLYDPYGRSYIHPNDYRPSVYGRSVDSGYLRNGRSSSEFYYTDKSQRNPKFNSFNDRSKDDFRNRTYIIFDAEENSPDRRLQPFPPPDYNRFGYPLPAYVPPYASPPPAMLPPVPYPNYYRNQYYPTVQTPIPWATSQKPYPDLTASNYVTRPLNSPEVQLPLTTRNRSLYPIGDYEKIKKT